MAGLVSKNKLNHDGLVSFVYMGVTYWEYDFTKDKNKKEQLLDLLNEEDKNTNPQIVYSPKPKEIKQQQIAPAQQNLQLPKGADKIIAYLENKK
jgi:hypothetical protein